MNRPLTTPKVCIFDFDGTLVDSMNELVAIAGTTLTLTHRLSRQEAERLYRVTSGLPFCEQLEELFPGDRRNPTAVTRFEEEKARGYLAHRFFTDAAETVAYLQSKEICVAVSSSNQQEMVDRFVAQGTIRFDLVLGYRERFTKGKCHFDHIRQVLGIATDAMLYVGDSLKDADGAVEENIRFIAKTGVTSRADFQSRYPAVPVIDRLAELREIL